MFLIPPHKASVHLPRIGHSTKGFNWYGTERLIRKHLASRGIPTFMYAFFFFFFFFFKANKTELFSESVYSTHLSHPSPPYPPNLHWQILSQQSGKEEHAISASVIHLCSINILPSTTVSQLKQFG